MVFGVCLIVVTAIVFGQCFSGVCGVFDCCNSQFVFGYVSVVYQLQRVTAIQVKEFLVCCQYKFMRAKIEPGG